MTTFLPQKHCIPLSQAFPECGVFVCVCVCKRSLRTCPQELTRGGVGVPLEQQGTAPTGLPPVVVTVYPSLKMGPAEVEQASEYQWNGGRRTLAIKSVILGLGGCGGKWLMQPGQAVSEEGSCGYSR